MGKTSHHQPHQTTVESNNSNATRDTRSVEFIQHVHEFRNRIFWVVLLFIVASALAYQFKDILVHLVLSPLGDQKLIYLTPAGGFSFIFQITMYAGAVVSAPFLIYQIYKFVTPALPVRARKYAALIFLAALLLMCGGVAFGYFVAVPSALTFLTTFAGGYVDASLTADSYLNFILGYVVGLGILFQLPLLLIFWHWIKPLTPKQLLNSERFMLVFAMIAAAIITPTPDIMNQLLIAGPILVIYQIGVVAILIMTHKERKRARRLAANRIRREGTVDTTPARKSELPVLTMPTIDDLVVRPRAVSQHQMKRPSITQPVAVPSVSLKPHPSIMKPPATLTKPGSATAAVRHHRPTLSSLSRPQARNDIRSRQAPVSRPIPAISRQRAVSIDGFALSA